MYGVMNELKVKKVSAASVPPEAIPALLDEEKVDFTAVDVVNWKDYPYRPSVQFRLAHTGDSLLLHFKVREASVRAVAAADNGRVWEDSCVEFFSIPAGDGVYYNLECNCAGTLLVGGGAGRKDRQHAPQAVLVSLLPSEWASVRGKWCSSFPPPRSSCTTWAPSRDAMCLPTSISAATCCRPRISCRGIPSGWRRPTSTARSRPAAFRAVNAYGEEYIEKAAPA